MNTANTPLITDRKAAYPRMVPQDFRLGYFDLNSDLMDENPSPPANAVYGTSEFPLLDDKVCRQLISAFTMERLDHNKVNYKVSSVPLQGWVERYARMVGLAGWTPPNGFMARWKFRLQVYKKCQANIVDECFDWMR